MLTSLAGYLQTGSGVPQDQLPLISRTIDLEYSTLVRETQWQD